VEEAQAALDLLARTLTTNRLVSDTGQAVVALISGYARTWRLLLHYDGCRSSKMIAKSPSAEKTAISN
jgi:hypothetical protein